jgi:hypothetical protein
MAKKKATKKSKITTVNMDEARKKAETPAYKTSGGMAAQVEEALRFYLQGTPHDLHHIRASLLPFEDVLTGGFCGEDAGGLLSKPHLTGVPYFLVSASDPQNTRNEYDFVVTAEEIWATLMMYDGKGGVECDEPFLITLKGLHNFLRQLPRHADAFAAVDRF